MGDRIHLRTENLNVFYGKTQALKKVNVRIPEKRITAIIGPSGCGKSTLLKTFNRLIENHENISVSGAVFVGEDNIYDSKEDVTLIRKKMGLLSQRPYPLPMSIFDNIAYGPRLHGVRNKKTLRFIVEKFLKTAGLWDEVQDRLNEPASHLSLGQQQRLCLARGLAVEPEIILADEPTSALDPISSNKIEEEFHLLKKDYTIVVVTHILRQAKRLADYVIFMYMGELIEHGPARELFDNPKEKMTREYMMGVIS